MGFLSFLRRWKRAPEGASVQHILVCGASRSGKSEAELARLVPLARRSDCAIVLLDPPGTLAVKFLLHLDDLGLTRRVLYDRLADTDRVPGYEWLVPSSHPDPLQREAENDERIRGFAAVLLRRRGIQDTAGTPVIEESLLAALRLFIHQKPPAPLPWLAEAFTVGSAIRARLLAHCEDADAVQKFHDYAALSFTARRGETGPAERILRAVCMSPAFRVRSGEATFDFDQFLDGRGILILDGSSRGNLSRDAASVMMGAIVLRVIQHCRTHAAGRVVLVLDEAVNAGLIGLHESQAIAEAGKWGLEFHILVQDPLSFPSLAIQSNVLQNCWRHEWFRQGSPQAARLAAEDVAIPLLNPLQLHHTENRFRTVGAGYDRVATVSHSAWFDPHGASIRHGKSWSTVLLPRRREVKSLQEHYTALQDQILLMQKALMVLQPGERFVRGDAAASTHEYVPMIEHLWSASEEQEARRRALEVVKQRPAFRSQTGHRSNSLSPPTHEGAAKRLDRRRTCAAR
jgi:hypothetical protein